MFREIDRAIILVLLFCMQWASMRAHEISNGTQYNTTEYMQIRKEWLLKDLQQSLSREVILNEQEQKLDNYLCSSCLNFQHHFLESNVYPPNQNFADVRAAIENTMLFKILMRMPKGGMLHLHAGSTGDADWLIQQAIKENVYVYMKEDGPILKGTMKFFLREKPLDGFQRIQDLIKNDSHFLFQMNEWITMNAKDGETPNPWNKFRDCFDRIDDLLYYLPFFVEYYTHALEIMAADHIQIVELRTSIDDLYDKEGNTYKDNEVVDLYKAIVKQIQKKYPRFALKLIVSDLRSKNLENQQLALKRAYKLKVDNPDIIVGYDLVGYETSGHSLIYYLRNLLTAAASFAKEYQTELPYYFHAGESGWGNDKNLYDAVLMNSRRIGHALNLFYFPALLQQIIKQNICIEVCPISNQMLGYVKDLRMHPAIGYIKQGVACVLSSDDPQMFGTKGLSYDFWEAIMAWNLNLSEVKQLCINSIQYSSLNAEEKEKAFFTWLDLWEEFVHQAITDLHLS